MGEGQKGVDRRGHAGIISVTETKSKSAGRRYFVADFIRSRVWSLALTIDGAGEACASDVREPTTDLGGTSQLAGVSSFGVDAAGELYLVSYNRGVVLKVVGPPPTPGTLCIIR